MRGSLLLSAWLVLGCAACAGMTHDTADAGPGVLPTPPHDGGSVDAGAALDAGSERRVDAGSRDAGTMEDAGHEEPVDAGSTDDAGDGEAVDAGETGVDAGEPGVDGGIPCSADGDLGICVETSACAAMEGMSSFAGHCPGPADIECCAPTPNVASNPPVPMGYELMQQSEVTADMTTWAVMILDDPTDYPMFSTATQMFGSLLVLARVEWHPPDFQNSVVHRGVTLYQPI